MRPDARIRLLRPGDAPALREIYRPYVEAGPYSLEYALPSPEEWQARVEGIAAEYPWLVCEQGGKPTGYAYGSRHRARIGYSWAAESSIYLAEEAQGRGIGRVLYEALLGLLRLQGYVQVLAVIGLPNARSLAFHQSLGFAEAGIFRSIGFKAGRWQDTVCLQLALAEPPAAPAFPRPFPALAGDPACLALLAEANRRLCPAAAEGEGA
jgi:phosphinothricin acetyltransferase